MVKELTVTATSMVQLPLLPPPPPAPSKTTVAEENGTLVHWVAPFDVFAHLLAVLQLAAAVATQKNVFPGHAAVPAYTPWGVRIARPVSKVHRTGRLKKAMRSRNPIYRFLLLHRPGCTGCVNAAS